MMLASPSTAIEETPGKGGKNQWIGLRENLQENPIFTGKNHGFL